MNAAVKQVVITFNVDGTSTIDAQGFMGVGCASATAAVEIALGGTDASNRSDKRKPEYAMNPANKQTN